MTGDKELVKSDPSLSPLMGKEGRELQRPVFTVVTSFLSRRVGAGKGLSDSPFCPVLMKDLCLYLYVLGDGSSRGAGFRVCSRLRSCRSPQGSRGRVISDSSLLGQERGSHCHSSPVPFLRVQSLTFTTVQEGTHVPVSGRTVFRSG